MQFGVDMIYHTFKLGVTSYRLTWYAESSKALTFGEKTLNSIEGPVYLENKLNFNRFSANLGLRYNTYWIDDHPFVTLEPRVLVNVLLTDDLSFKSSYSIMQ